MMNKKEFAAYLNGLIDRSQQVKHCNYNIGDTAQIFDDLTRDLSNREIGLFVDDLHDMTYGRGWHHFQFMLTGEKQGELRCRVLRAIGALTHTQLIVKDSMRADWKNHLRGEVADAHVRRSADITEELKSKANGIVYPIVENYVRKTRRHDLIGDVDRAIKASGEPNPCAEVLLDAHDEVYDGPCKAIPSPATLNKMRAEADAMLDATFSRPHFKDCICTDCHNARVARCLTQVKV